MKKILIITPLLLILITSQASAFELVNQKPTSRKFCLGAEIGMPYYALSATYNLNQQLSIQALAGQSYPISSSDSFSTKDDINLLLAGKAVYRLTNNIDYDFYLFGITGQINKEMDIGGGVGTEFSTLNLPNNIRYQVEAGYTINNSMLTNVGIKLYF